MQWFHLPPKIRKTVGSDPVQTSMNVLRDCIIRRKKNNRHTEKVQQSNGVTADQGQSAWECVGEIYRGVCTAHFYMRSETVSRQKTVPHLFRRQAKHQRQHHGDDLRVLSSGDCRGCPAWFTLKTDGHHECEVLLPP